MQLISKLEELARKARARAPARARGLLERLENAYRARRGERPATEPPVASSSTSTTTTTVEPAATAAPAPKQENWELRSQAELVDHIESYYHAGLRRDLPQLIEAARRIEREHAGHAAVPAGLADHLQDMYAALDSHMMKEERVLFPTLRTGARGGPIDMPIRMMEREHEEHDQALEKIRELTHGLVAPADVPEAWQALYTGLATLETELRQHIYLENNVLFARALGER